MAKPTPETPAPARKLPEPDLTRSRKEQVKQGIMTADSALNVLAFSARSAAEESLPHESSAVRFAAADTAESLLRETRTYKWLKKRA